MVSRRAPWIGLLVTLALVAAAFAVPPLTGWEVNSRESEGTPIAPLHGTWEPKWFGPGTLVALALAFLGWRYAAELAQRLPWRRLLLTSYVVGLAWLVALAWVDGEEGISRVLGNPFEYLRTAREVDSVPVLLETYVDRIPYSAEPDNWVVHVAGHPPLALLFFVGLVRLGLGGDLAAGYVVTAIAATTALAVMVLLRTLGREDLARLAAPFLVLTPAAVFMAVSADAMFAAVAAWGLALLGVAATRTGRTWVPWSVAAGLVLGSCVLLSYGLVLLGFLALAVLALAGSWRPLPVAVVAALAVVVGFAVGGFAWWEAYPVLNDRYWDGLASARPAAYWMWGNLAILAVCAGPLLGAGFAVLRRTSDRVVLFLVGGAALAVAAADLSRMSKAEVERIWLPFVPWLTLSVVLLPHAGADGDSACSWSPPWWSSTSSTRRGDQAGTTELARSWSGRGRANAATDEGSRDACVEIKPARPSLRGRGPDEVERTPRLTKEVATRVSRPPHPSDHRDHGVVLRRPPGSRQARPPGSRQARPPGLRSTTGPPLDHRGSTMTRRLVTNRP